MSHTIDLDNYFKRIGYEGPATVTLNMLKVLHEKHTKAIPFENLNPLLGIEVKLDPESLEQKMVDNKRGGYCYEQNLLFKYVLETIGFPVKGLAARIRWNKEEDEITPRSHMLLQIEVDRKNYLADVGFGNNTLTSPLLLESDIIQQTPHEPRRLIEEENKFIMQTLIGDEWRDLYQFDLRENYRPDYEVTNWYLSHHPESHFVTGLIAARPAPERRYTLRNNKFSIHHLDRETEKRTLKSVGELRGILEHTLLLELPKVPELDESLQQLVNPERETVA